MSLPPATPRPCTGCPWVRTSIRGWLGPHTAEEWCTIAHDEQPIACHETIKDVNDAGFGEWDHPKMKQCRGAAMFRANVCKSPRNPEIETGPRDTDLVFSWNDEFIEHHTPVGIRK